MYLCAKNKIPSCSGSKIQAKHTDKQKRRQKDLSEIVTHPFTQMVKIEVEGVINCPHLKRKVTA